MFASVRWKSMILCYCEVSGDLTTELMFQRRYKLTCTAKPSTGVISVTSDNGAASVTIAAYITCDVPVLIYHIIVSFRMCTKVRSIFAPSLKSIIKLLQIICPIVISIWIDAVLDVHVTLVRCWNQVVSKILIASLQLQI